MNIVRIWVAADDIDRFAQEMSLNGYTAEVVPRDSGQWRLRVCTNAPRQAIHIIAKRLNIRASE